MGNLQKDWDAAKPISNADWENATPINVPAPPEPPPPDTMSPVEGASPWEAGEVPSFGTAAKEMGSAAVRHGLPIAAGVAGGLVPSAGPVTGPLAAVTTDMLLSKAYGEGDTPDSGRKTSFLTDVGAGLLPPVAKGAYGVAKKLVPPSVEAKLAATIRDGIAKGIRPSVAGKANFPQAQKYYERAQSAVESIIENKSGLQLTDDTGNVVKGQLPKNLSQFSQAIDQTKRSIFAKYDAMARASDDLGRTVDLGGVVSELQSFRASRVNQIVSGGGGMHGGPLARADSLIGSMSGQKLSLSETQEMISLLNGRLKAFYANPSPDLAGAAAIDALAVNKLRSALDSAVEKYGYQQLKNQYGALRSIEKEVASRAAVDARKNVKGLIDFADIASAAEAARAVATMSAGPAAASISIKALKEWYKHLNNPNRIVGKMFEDADKLITKRVAGEVPLRALPPGPRAMGGAMPESGIKVTGGGWPGYGPKAIAGERPLLSLPPKGGTGAPTPLQGSRGLLFREFGHGASNPAYDMTDTEMLEAIRKGKRSLLR